MTYLKQLCIVILTLASVSSCRSVKTIQSAIAKRDTTQVVAIASINAVIPDSPGSGPDSLPFIRKIRDSLQKNYINFQSFTGKAKVHYEKSDGDKNDFMATILIRKDSIIWINITGPFGVNVIRAIITPDSVKVLDRLENTATLWSVERLQELTQMPMTFTHLQNLLIGNPVFFEGNINSYKVDDKSISVLCQDEFFKHLLTLNKDDYSLQSSKLDDVDATRARTAHISYGNYQYSKNGNRFSTYRKITSSEKSTLDIEMDFKQFDFNKTQDYPFSIPRNYRIL